MKEMDKLNLHDYKPLREIVFEHLRESIILGKMKPGERLMEIQLAESLGVSRTPVREAIRKLELEGLVIMVPRKGAYVSEVSLKDIKEALEIRASIEGLGAYLAAERMEEDEIEALKKKHEELKICINDGDVACIVEKDTELHDIIFKATRNNMLMDLVDGLREQVQRFRVSYVSSHHKSSELAKEHQKIIDAIEMRDKEAAKKYAEEHIEISKKYIVSDFKNNKES
ncbi:GntR family transcriptional regulator [Clostridium sp. D2Q-11]|uniref:GntR family transcriptional regulator n=1 Tax=Anaeromonas frigoriresistens TaxID=2683708 RepID=A0A942Z7M0_9FIRM|nr:GntR family transcriptional regulator [Anaeromonas frigoriresistens]MBS4537024.1 GntR family transcriptional regulator [Anaeromonas frigoriresistens]